MVGKAFRREKQSDSGSNNFIFNHNEKSNYCKFRNFHENFIFPHSIKRHICDTKIFDKGMMYLHQ